MTIPEPDVILAAIERAVRHNTNGELDVPWGSVVAHLGLPKGAKTTLRLRPHVRDLEAAGLVVQSIRRSAARWALTDKGHLQLAEAGEVALSESPQHQAWREARTLAEKQIDTFRYEARAALDYALCLFDMGSDWRILDNMATCLHEEFVRLSSATYCLHEWDEPSDARPDIRPSRIGLRDTAGWQRREL